MKYYNIFSRYVIYSNHNFRNYVLQRDSDQRKASFFGIPSLSPCVEDDLKEDKFLFSTFENKESYSSNKSFLSQYVHHNESSKTSCRARRGSIACDASVSPFGIGCGSSALFNGRLFQDLSPNVTKRRQSIPAIAVHRATPGIYFPCISYFRFHIYLYRYGPRCKQRSIDL